MTIVVRDGAGQEIARVKRQVHADKQGAYYVLRAGKRLRVERSNEKHVYVAVVENGTQSEPSNEVGG